MAEAPPNNGDEHPKDPDGPDRNGNGKVIDMQKNAVVVRSMIENMLLQQCPLAKSLDDNIPFTNEDGSALNEADRQSREDVLILTNETTKVLKSIEDKQFIVKLPPEICENFKPELIDRILTICDYVDSEEAQLIIDGIKKEGGVYLDPHLDSDFRIALTNGVSKMADTKPDNAENVDSKILGGEKLLSHAEYRMASDFPENDVSEVMNGEAKKSEALARHIMAVRLQEEIAESGDIDEEELVDLILTRIRGQLTLMHDPIAQQLSTLRAVEVPNKAEEGADKPMKKIDVLGGRGNSDFRRLQRILMILNYYLKGIETLRQVRGFFR